MTDTTPRLALPELSAAQAQKHVTVNESLVKLDALVDLHILGLYTTTPPASPSDGDAYVTGGSSGGAWSGYDGKIAYCIDGSWRFYTPFRGLRAYCAADYKFYLYNGSAWEAEKVSGRTVTLGGDLSFAGALAQTGAYSWSLGIPGAYNYTMPAVSGTLAALNLAQTWTAAQTVSSSIFLAVDPLYPSHVGIGTTTPGAELPGDKVLEVLSAGTTRIEAYSTGRFSCFNFGSGVGAQHTTGFVVVDDTDNVIWVGSGTNTPLTFGSYATARFQITAAGHFIPYLSATYNIGDASHAVNNMWLQNAATVVSDAAHKTEIRHWQASTDTTAMTADTATASWTAAELAVGKSLARLVAMFKMKAAVAEKGSDKARIHAGWIAQEVIAAFAAQGLDALAYGCVGFDHATKTVTKTRTVKKQKTEAKTKTEAVEKITVTDGVAVVITEPTTTNYDDPVFETLAVKDADGNIIFGRTYQNPVMEDVTETYTEQEPDYEDDGVTQKHTYSVRMGELTCFVIAAQDARIAALEAKAT
jgi:hypothetical protein